MKRVILSCSVCFYLYAVIENYRQFGNHRRDRDRAALSVLVGERSPDHICLSFKTGKNMEEQVETHYFLSNGQ